MKKRIEMLQDCLAVLAEGDVADADAVIHTLNHMSTWNLLKPLWRASELPATARNNMANNAEVES